MNPTHGLDAIQGVQAHAAHTITPRPAHHGLDSAPLGPHEMRALRQAFADATCIAASFMLLNEHNQAITARLESNLAVATGQAFFGTAHPWIWAIDIDDARHPAVATLMATLDDLDLSYIECQSGGGTDRLHLFVHREDTELCARVAEEVEHAHGSVRPAIDWRLQHTGSPIRPPLAPHRRGGASEPVIDWEEALETLQSWAPISVRSTTGMPHWVECYLNGDWEGAATLGKRVPRRADGEVDRSAVDVAIALSFCNIGLGFDEYYQHRRPGGSHPSPKAAELGLKATGYLQRQWSDALSRPASIAKVREGLDRLDEFLLVVESDESLTLKDRCVLHGFVELCRQLNKTSIAVSYRQIIEASNTSMGTVSKSLSSGRLSKYLTEPDEPTDHTWYGTKQYRLRALDALTEAGSRNEQSYLSTGGVRQDCSQYDLPSRIHPVFSERQGALGQKGYQTIQAFDPHEPRTQTEALQRASNVGRTAFKRNVAKLKHYGAILPGPENPRQYRRNPFFDWDRLASDLGVADIRKRREQRHDEQRRQDNVNLLRKGFIDASELANRTAALTQKERRRSSTVENCAPTWVDPLTGELIGTSTPTSKQCRACGRPTIRTNDETGLPWHDGCLMPAWIARIERRNGNSIPDHLIKPPPELDWGEFDIPSGEASHQVRTPTDGHITNEEAA